MAVVKGINAGFVEEAPTINPSGLNLNVDTLSIAFKDVAPAGAIKITEIGWYCDNATQESNFEIGLYSHDAGNDLPLNRLYVDNINAKGTGLGWKTVAVDWEITPGTTYWIAIQLDDTATITRTNQTLDGARYSSKAPTTSLATPWVSDNTDVTAISIYALYEEAEGFPHSQAIIIA